ncbi:hypothetical protein SEUCBS139899_006217 [Sporothrix eucalyptigena]|uniref:Centromere protein M n=1 Tax=Sporothrix eucalyptigena TaxID=1812306 RepID=A0ABP0ASC5_9PEZI
MIRFLLVAPADVDKPDMTNKLQRLARRKNGLGGVILFLLANDDGDGHNMAAYSQIQIDLRDTDLSILPLMAVATLPATVAAFCSQFTMPLRADYCTSPDNTLHDLLRMYFGDPVPLSLDGAKRLVAATEEAAHHRPSGNATLQDVVRFCSGLETRGPHRLADLLGVEDAARLADF